MRLEKKKKDSRLWCQSTPPRTEHSGEVLNRLQFYNLSCLIRLPSHFHLWNNFHRKSGVLNILKHFSPLFRQTCQRHSQHSPSPFTHLQRAPHHSHLPSIPQHLCSCSPTKSPVVSSLQLTGLRDVFHIIDWSLPLEALFSAFLETAFPSSPSQFPLLALFFFPHCFQSMSWRICRLTDWKILAFCPSHSAGPSPAMAKTLGVILDFSCSSNSQPPPSTTCPLSLGNSSFEELL